MKCNECSDIDIADAVAVSEAKRIFSLEIGGHTFESTACHGGFASVDQGHAPGLCTLLMHLHTVVAHVKRDIGHVQEVVRKIFLDQIAFVAAADHEVMDPMVGVNLHDVPEDGFTANFDHGLGLEVCFLGNTCSEASSEDDGFHRAIASVMSLDECAALANDKLARLSRGEVRKNPLDNDLHHAF